MTTKFGNQTIANRRMGAPLCTTVIVTDQQVVRKQTSDSTYFAAN